MSTPIFRTASGQTGRDAYINEAQAIANAQRELDARMARLADAIVTENETLTTWDGFLMPHGGEAQECDLVHLTGRNFFRTASQAQEVCDRLLATKSNPFLHNN